MCRVQSCPIPTDDGKADGKEDGKDETVEAILELARVVAPLPWRAILIGGSILSYQRQSVPPPWHGVPSRVELPSLLPRPRPFPHR